MAVLALVVFLLLWLVALAGVILPVLPGVPVAALGALLAAWMTGFRTLDLGPLVAVGVLTAAALLVDVAASYLGARVYGARRPGLWGGVFGSLAGLLLFPPFGFVIGALVGAVGAELLTGRPLAEAVRAGLGAFLGTLGGLVAKVLVLVAMVVVVLPRLIALL